MHLRQISGGFLVQEPHGFIATRNDWRVVTKRQPTEDEWRDAELAWRLVRFQPNYRAVRKWKGRLRKG